MSNQQQIDQELREYLEKEPNLNRNDRLNYLRAIFNKHFEFNQLEHVVNSVDMHLIVSGAKEKYTKLRLPASISRIQVDSSQLPHLAMVESLISYLRGMNLLKKLVKIDYTE